jgi:predicted SAM-dependent methyltransferase
MKRIPRIDYSKTILLDCGCANQKKDGYMGIDIDDDGQEIVWDLRDGIPLADGCVKDINVCHFLEHLTNKESKEFISEAQRVLMVGGTLTAKQPHVRHATAFYPDHESFWNELRVESIQRNEPGWEIVSNIFNGFELEFQLKKINTG